MSYQPPWPEWRLRPHGTSARHRWHYRHGEKPCEACREAHNRDHAAAERQRRRRTAT
jgi:hypothetical protein